MTRDSAVDRHYALGGVLDTIRNALEALGKRIDRLEVSDLAPVDEFHIRGREATVELAARASLGTEHRVLDVGSGLGGSARYLASEHGCRVVGVDLTREYVETARALTGWVGLDDQVEFHCASALQMPFEDDSFDVAWTEHVQMNIEDKEAFYGEIKRVLKPGGALLFHDIFQGASHSRGGHFLGTPAGLHLPVPWAETASISHLARTETVRGLLEDAGLKLSDWQDVSQKSVDWLEGALARMADAGPPPIGVHLLMGENAPTKLANMTRNLKEQRIAVVQAMATKV